MSPRTLERIRRRIMGAGKLALYLLGTAFVKPFLRKGTSLADFNSLTSPRVLYVSLAYRGDLILTLPAIAALKKRFPNSQITCWIRGYNVTLARLFPEIDEIISYDTYPDSGISLLAGFWKLGRHRHFITDIQARHFDVLIDDSGCGFSAFVGARARIPLRIGRDTQGFGFLYHYESPYNENEHLVEKRLRLLSLLGIEFTYPERWRIFVDGALVKKARAKIELEPQEQFFTIQSLAGWEAKNWQDEKVIEVVNGFVKATGLTPVFVGGAVDRERIDKMRAQIEGRSLSGAGLLELSDTFALISRAQIHFGVDSVGSHMAAAAGIKSVTLFGPTNPLLSAFLSHDNIVVMREISCSPAKDHQYCALDAGRLCPKFVCMESLETGEVLDVLIEHWKGSIRSQVVIL